jgi:hypothetical protein
MTNYLMNANVAMLVNLRLSSITVNPPQTIDVSQSDWKTCHWVPYCEAIPGDGHRNLFF